MQPTRIVQRCITETRIERVFEANRAMDASIGMSELVAPIVNQRAHGRRRYRPTPSVPIKTAYPRAVIARPTSFLGVARNARSRARSNKRDDEGRCTAWAICMTRSTGSRWIAKRTVVPSAARSIAFNALKATIHGKKDPRVVTANDYRPPPNMSWTTACQNG